VDAETWNFYDLKQFVYSFLDKAYLFLQVK